MLHKLNFFQRADSTNIIHALKKKKIQEMKNGNDSLEILSMTLQNYFNSRIHEVIKEFNENFFNIAVKNIKENTNETISEKQVKQSPCRKFMNTIRTSNKAFVPISLLFEGFLYKFIFIFFRFKKYLEISCSILQNHCFLSTLILLHQHPL